MSFDVTPILVLENGRPAEFHGETNALGSVLK